MVPVRHGRDRAEADAVRVESRVLPRSPAVPGQDGNARGQRLLVGDSLRLVHAEEDHRAAAPQQALEVFLAVGAVADLGGAGVPRVELVADRLEQVGLKPFAFPHQLVIHQVVHLLAGGGGRLP